MATAKAPYSIFELAPSQPGPQRRSPSTSDVPGDVHRPGRSFLDIRGGRQRRSRPGGDARHSARSAPTGSDARRLSPAALLTIRRRGSEASSPNRYDQSLDRGRPLDAALSIGTLAELATGTACRARPGRRTNRPFAPGLDRSSSPIHEGYRAFPARAHAPSGVSAHEDNCAAKAHSAFARFSPPAAKPSAWPRRFSPHPTATNRMATMLTATLTHLKYFRPHPLPSRSHRPRRRPLFEPPLRLLPGCSRLSFRRLTNWSSSPRGPHPRCGRGTSSYKVW